MVKELVNMILRIINEVCKNCMIPIVIETCWTGWKVNPCQTHQYPPNAISGPMIKLAILNTR